MQWDEFIFNFSNIGTRRKKTNVKARPKSFGLHHMCVSRRSYYSVLFSLHAVILIEAGLWLPNTAGTTFRCVCRIARRCKPSWWCIDSFPFYFSASIAARALLCATFSFLIRSSISLSMVPPDCDVTVGCNAISRLRCVKQGWPIAKRRENQARKWIIMRCSPWPFMVFSSCPCENGATNQFNHS